MKSVCTNDLETLENFNPLLNIGPIVIPNCSLLPDPNGGQAPECYLPTTTPDFQNYGSEFTGSSATVAGSVLPKPLLT